MVPLSYPVSAIARSGIYDVREEQDDRYFVVEQCLADGFRSSRCRRRWREWGRLVGHCVSVWLQKLLAAAVDARRCGAHGMECFPGESCCRRACKSRSSCDAKSGFRSGSTFGAGPRNSSAHLPFKKISILASL